MKLSKRQLKRIIREEKIKLQEGTHEKLNSDVTGDDSNLDQEVYFGLEEDILELCESIGISPSALSQSQSIDEALCKKYADNPRYAKYGVTVSDVLEELKNVIDDLRSQSGM